MVRDKRLFQAVGVLVGMNTTFQLCSGGARSELCDITKDHGISSRSANVRIRQANTTFVIELPTSAV